MELSRCTKPNMYLSLFNFPKQTCKNNRTISSILTSGCCSCSDALPKNAIPLLVRSRNFGAFLLLRLHRIWGEQNLTLLLVWRPKVVLRWQSVPSAFKFVLEHPTQTRTTFLSFFSFQECQLDPSESDKDSTIRILRLVKSLQCKTVSKALSLSLSLSLHLSSPLLLFGTMQRDYFLLFEILCLPFFRNAMPSSKRLKWRLTCPQQQIQFTALEGGILFVGKDAIFWVLMPALQLKPLRVLKLLRILKTVQLIGCGVHCDSHVFFKEKLHFVERITNRAGGLKTRCRTGSDPFSWSLPGSFSTSPFPSIFSAVRTGESR